MRPWAAPLVLAVVLLAGFACLLAVLTFLNGGPGPGLDAGLIARLP